MEISARRPLLTPNRKLTLALVLLAGNLTLNLFASLCYKEGGTDSASRWHYFLAGSALGISATVLLMGLYKLMNVNLAMVVTTSGTGLLVQFTFWRLYHTSLTPIQAGGIALTLAGTALASWPGAKSPVPGPEPETNPEFAT